MIGIIIAMEEELIHLKKNLKLKSKIHLHGYEFLLFDFRNVNYVLIISGIGKTNAAISATLLINEFKPEYILNFGSAGTATQEVDIFDLILVEKAFHYDVDATAFEYELGQLPKENLYFYSPDWLLIKFEKSLNQSAIKFKRGMACSGDNFITMKNINNFPLIIESGTLVIDMEIASIMQTSKQLKTPVISLKYITDSVFKDDSKPDFKINVEKSSLLLLKLLAVLE